MRPAGIWTGLAIAYLLVGMVVDVMAQDEEFLAAIAPTPAGDGHLGLLESGATVQIRFPVPKPLPPQYLLELGNVVAFSGRGTSYRLVLRRDAPDGPVIYEGPTVANGDQWNATNAQPIDIGRSLRAEDAARGYVDIYVSAVVEGDGWTVYRHNAGRPIGVRVPTAESIEAARQAQMAAERGIAVIPWPQKITLAAGEMKLSARTRIVLPARATQAARFAAADMAEQIAEACGLKLTVREGLSATRGDIRLGYDKSVKGGEEGYRVVVDDQGVRLLGGGEAGLFYAAQTLAQLVTRQGSVPHVTIEDWPAYPLRGIQYDVARGQTVNVEWWKRIIRALARYKLNAIMVYGENDYRFKAYPFLGREGTFTPEKAAELSAYARAYHVQLIPQFEALGHASAVLSRDELKDLREAGDPWVFCTSNPATWEFLDTVIGELCEQFPDSKYIHVGADEFEFSFGKCAQCRAKVEREGYTALYAEHMNRLNELVRKRGRTMLFWPSHGGPTPELSYLTIKAADLLQRDCIPTEWIYHGPAAYPEIEQYQKLGFKDVWASPAVVCFSVVWPDYATTYRGIRGFLRAGAQRGIGGAMTTTWEWMFGGVVANSLPGMVYAAECAWSLGKTPVEDFERRYGQNWLGLEPAEAGQMVRETLIFPWPEKGPAAALRDGWGMRQMVWEGLRTLRPRIALRRPELREAASAMLEAVDQALARLEKLRAAARRNADLLEFTELAYRLYRLAALKLIATDAATVAYREAGQKLGQDRSAAATCLERAAQAIEGTVPELDRCLTLAGAAVARLGAWEGDVRALEGQKKDALALAAELRDLADQCRRGERDALPPGVGYGLVAGRLIRIGGWEPAQVTEEGVELRFDVTGKLPTAGEVSVELSYTRGAHGLSIERVALLADGVEIAADTHGGWTGAGSRDNVYVLRLPEVSPGARCELVAKVRSHGGNDSYGDVWLIIGE